MELTDSRVRRIAAALDAKLTGSCPLCSARQWIFESAVMLFEGKELAEMGLAAVLANQKPRTRIVPAIPVACGNCGNTVFMNVYILGLADLWAGHIPAGPER